MSCKNYINERADLCYVLHFPGNSLNDFQEMLDYNLDRSFSVSGNISIISIMDMKCYKNSPIRRQCELNHVRLYNTALEEHKWSNPLKITHILACLDMITTEYALIIDGRDAVITNSLDKKFLAKVRAFDKPIIYNGTPTAFPKLPVEPIQEIFQIKGKQKFLNAGVCIGRVDALKEFYQVCQGISDQRQNEKSEQIIVRLARQQRKDLVAIDHNNELFRIVHRYDTKVVETPSKFIIY